MVTDKDRLDGFALDLARQIEGAIPSWVKQTAITRLVSPPSVSVQAEIDKAAAEATTEVGLKLKNLFGKDIDTQDTTPLAIIREAVPHVTNILVQAGIPEVGRDAHARQIHPEDIYDITPGSYLDLGDPVQQASIMWGAAKAHVHIQRRRAEGQR